MGVGFVELAKKFAYCRFGTAPALEQVSKAEMLSDD